MADPERITPQEAYRKVKDGAALLVCAYDDEGKCKSMRLEGAVTFGEFRSKLPSLSKEHPIVFYCA